VILSVSGQLGKKTAEVPKNRARDQAFFWDSNNSSPCADGRNFKNLPNQAYVAALGPQLNSIMLDNVGNKNTTS